MAHSTSTADCVTCELQQFVGDFFDELDRDGLNITKFYFEDGEFAVGGRVFAGHDAIRKFYADRLASVRADPSGQIRTARHTFVNLRVSMGDDGQASMRFINLTYTGQGPPPVKDLLGPSVISDCLMVCQRNAAQRWQIRRFAGEAIFIGSDPLMNKLAVKS